MSFDHLAPIYDHLARLVFGRALYDSQTSFLALIPENARVLVIGGGTGWILKYLPSDSKNVSYIDSSKKMIEMASNVSVNFPIHFYASRFQDTKLSDDNFDVIITNFFLDMFTELKLQDLIEKMNENLVDDGMILSTDFIDGAKWWQRFMLSVMYLFFRLFAGLANRKLGDWQSVFTRTGLQLADSKFFFRGFIVSTVFRKDKIT